MGREVLFVGGIPISPASAVFEKIARAMGPLTPRIPDGDQRGWIMAATESLAANPALEPTGVVELSRGGVAVPTFALRDGYSAEDLSLGPYGYGAVAASSLAAFRELRDKGVVLPQTRFQVTLPGPGTSSYMVAMDPDLLLPIAREALAREIEAIAAAVPPDELAIQLDIAMEAEHEEYRRRPNAFDTPVHETFDWTMEQMAESAAWLADRIPIGAELGFHICSIWHHYQPGGQDNAVLVDTANALASRVQRPIDYVHMPTIPEHDVEDFAPLGDLQLGDETKLYLGVIHRDDGLEGAKRRIAAARTVVDDFGVASFCGLGNPIVARKLASLEVGDALHESLHDGGAGLDSDLELHQAVAALDDV